MIPRVQQKFSVWSIDSCPIAFKVILPKDPDDDDVSDEDEEDDGEEEKSAVVRERDE